ncbi:hypothetical protein [Acidiplasma cupricumulans]|nr:hypothetical protein [Acidiplasma cupricumulans]
MNNHGKYPMKISFQFSLDRTDIEILNAMATSRFLKINEMLNLL